MAARIYSTRFLHGGLVAGFTDWQVPAGMRAVIKHIQISNAAPVVGQVQVVVAGFSVARWDFQASTLQASLACTVVAYAGEFIQVYVAVPPLPVTICGFLFADDGPAPGVLPAPPIAPPPEHAGPWDLEAIAA